MRFLHGGLFGAVGIPKLLLRPLVFILYSETVDVPSGAQSLLTWGFTKNRNPKINTPPPPPPPQTLNPKP